MVYIHIYIYIYTHTLEKKMWWQRVGHNLVTKQQHTYICMYMCIYIHTQWTQLCKPIILQLKNKFKIKNKEWNSAICNNMDGLRGYHTKWSKLDGEG